MTPTQTGEEMRKFADACVERIAGIGADQYYNPETGLQLFETMSMGDLITYYNEELFDLATYAMMTKIRLDRIQRVLSADSALQHLLTLAKQASKGEPGVFEAVKLRSSLRTAVKNVQAIYYGQETFDASGTGDAGISV